MKRHEKDLSPQELEVLRYLWDGMQRKEIAQVMGLSDKTVQNYTLTLYQKLNVHTNVQAVREGVERGILKVALREQ